MKLALCIFMNLKYMKKILLNQLDMFFSEFECNPSSALELINLPLPFFAVAISARIRLD